MRVSDAIANGALSERVYASLREMIIDGRFQPGARLVERVLCEVLQVSRIPLREALPRLEADGFVRLLPRRGAVVRQITLRDIGDLFAVRESLEPLAARLAARRVAEGHASASETEGLRDLVTRARRALADGDEQGAAAANVAFHRGIVTLAGNDLLSLLMQPLDGRMEWLFRMTADRDLDVQCHEHEQLYTALMAGDAELAASLAYVHVASGRTPSLLSLADLLPTE
ncbi:GntR family transcriptional regulator [Actinocorallia aurea]